MNDASPKDAEHDSIQENMFQLLCAGITGVDPFAIDVKASYTIGQVMTLIEETTGHPINEATLRYNMKVLEMDKTLNDYNIQSSASIKIRD